MKVRFELTINWDWSLDCRTRSFKRVEDAFDFMSEYMSSIIKESTVRECQHMGVEEARIVPLEDITLSSGMVLRGVGGK